MRVMWIHNWQPDKLPPLILNSIKGFEKLNIEIQLEYLGNLRSTKNIFNKIKYLKKASKDYDLIHSQYGSMCSYIGSFIKNKPKIISLHGSDFNVNAGNIELNNFHTRLARFLSLRAMLHYDHIISVSKRMKNEIENIFPFKRVSSIPYPIIMEDFYPINKELAREKLNIGLDKILILFNIANINASVKRFTLAKEAVTLVQKKLSNVKLHIVNNVSYSAVPLHVNACNLILLTSKSEGWPNAIKEALACNIPFVSTDVSDLSYIADKEESCKISEPIASEISKNILNVINYNKKIDLRKYVQDMDIQNTCNKIENLYKTTIEEFKLYDKS